MQYKIMKARLRRPESDLHSEHREAQTSLCLARHRSFKLDMRKDQRRNGGSMKKRIGYLLVLTALAIGLFYSGKSVGAAGTEAGSVGDPLITQSYLELRLAEITGDTASSSFIKVSVSKGKTIMASEGTELMLYSGSGAVAGTDGMVNLTGGEVFSAGNTMVKYCLFLSVGDDSGITAASAMTLYVKGSYHIK